MSEPGSMTTPQPMIQRRPLWRMPDGIVCSTYFSRPTTTVWPALLPPEKRTTTSTCGVMTSTTLPLPSSPHCAPITTMFLAMSCPSHSLEALGRIREDLGHRQRALAAAAEIERQQLAGRRAWTAGDEHVVHALGARIFDRFFESTTDDVARHRRPEIAKASRQGQRRGFFRREVDDEEVGSRQLDRHLLALHDGQRPRDVEGEADGRAVVAEPSEHVVVAAAARQGGGDSSRTRRSSVEASLRASASRRARWRAVSAEASSSRPRKKSGCPRSIWKRSRPSARRPSMVIAMTSTSASGFSSPISSTPAW